MKKLFIIIMFVLAWISIGLAFIPKVVRADHPTRFEFVSNQIMSNGDGSYIRRIETWHDKESGVELICVIGDTHGNPSCVTTGRNWK